MSEISEMDNVSTKSSTSLVVEGRRSSISSSEKINFNRIKAVSDEEAAAIDPSHPYSLLDTTGKPKSILKTNSKYALRAKSGIEVQQEPVYIPKRDHGEDPEKSPVRNHRNSVGLALLKVPLKEITPVTLEIKPVVTSVIVFDSKEVEKDKPSGGGFFKGLFRKKSISTPPAATPTGPKNKRDSIAVRKIQKSASSSKVVTTTQVVLPAIAITSSSPSNVSTMNETTETKSAPPELF